MSLRKAWTGLPARRSARQYDACAGSGPCWWRPTAAMSSPSRTASCTSARKPLAWPRSSRAAASELRENPGIVLEQQANIGDSVADHREALHAHAEGEARVSLRVDPRVRKDVRVDHPSAEHLQPPGPLTDAARRPRRSGAEGALDVHLGTRLDEGEVAWPEADRKPTTVEPLGESSQHTLQLRKADALIDEESIDLMEHRRVRAVVVATPVDRASAHDGHRGPSRGHLAHLDRGRVGPKKRPCGVAPFHGDPEAVLHVHRGVIGRETELRAVVRLELHLRTPCPHEAERLEDVEDLEPHLREWMQMPAQRRSPAWKRQVEWTRVERRLARRAVDLCEPLLAGALDLRLDSVHTLADCPSLGRRDLGEPSEGSGKLPLLAEHLRTERPQ